VDADKSFVEQELNLSSGKQQYVVYYHFYFSCFGKYIAIANSK